MGAGLTFLRRHLETLTLPEKLAYLSTQTTPIATCIEADSSLANYSRIIQKLRDDIARDPEVMRLRKELTELRGQVASTLKKAARQMDSDLVALDFPTIGFDSDRMAHLCNIIEKDPNQITTYEQILDEAKAWWQREEIRAKIRQRLEAAQHTVRQNRAPGRRRKYPAPVDYAVKLRKQKNRPTMLKLYDDCSKKYPKQMAKVQFTSFKMAVLREERDKLTLKPKTK